MQRQIQAYDSNHSRREFIKMTALAGIGIGLAGLHACGPSTGKPTVIRIYGTKTLNLDDTSWIQAKKDLGYSIIFEDNGNDTGPIISNMIHGNAAYDFDLGAIQGGVEEELAIAGKIVPWDLTKIPNWEGVWDWVKKIPNCVVNGKQYGLPIVVNADSIIYLPEKMGGKVESYEVIFDSKYKGRVAMEDAWINSVIFTAIYLKENSIMPINNPGDLSESELGAVMEFLIKKKKDGQFKTFWTKWESAAQLLKDGEVFAMTGWEPIVHRLKEEGINAEYAMPREGYEGWSNDLMITVGAAKRNIVEDVHKFANWELSGYYGCEMAKGGYVVPTDLSVKYARTSKKYDPEIQQAKLDHVRDKFLKGKMYWQNTRPQNYKLYESWWAKLRTS